MGTLRSVHVQVIEGRLVEVPTPDASGADRRAFGEFIGPRGELASYAFGWTTGADPHVARLSIGIGAGNPGGATFHAVVHAHEDSYAFGLSDLPFEHVAEGGPDISAAHARNHEDLPFVWWVADNVMDSDRRAWWMRHWLLRTRCIQTAEVFDLQEPVLLVAHDDDELWQLVGRSDAGDNGKISHLHHAVDQDPTLIDVLDLGSGHRATRTSVTGQWTRHERL